jgi:hypothetical protein
MNVVESVLSRDADVLYFPTKEAILRLTQLKCQSMLA